MMGTACSICRFHNRQKVYLTNDIKQNRPKEKEQNQKTYKLIQYQSSNVFVKYNYERHYITQHRIT